LPQFEFLKIALGKECIEMVICNVCTTYSSNIKINYMY
jgi:hypothetical protein